MTIPHRCASAQQILWEAGQKSLQGGLTLQIFPLLYPYVSRCERPHSQIRQLYFHRLRIPHLPRHTSGKAAGGTYQDLPSLRRWPPPHMADVTATYGETEGPLGRSEVTQHTPHQPLRGFPQELLRHPLCQREASAQRAGWIERPDRIGIHPGAHGSPAMHRMPETCNQDRLGDLQERTAAMNAETAQPMGQMAWKWTKNSQ